MPLPQGAQLEEKLLSVAVLVWVEVTPAGLASQYLLVLLGLGCRI